MIRSDWAQHGTAMAKNGMAIREWLGGDRVMIAVPYAAKYAEPRNLEREAADYILPADVERVVVSYADLSRQLAGDKVLPLPVLALHPFDAKDCDRLRTMVDEDRLARVCVLVWSAQHQSLMWLKGQQGLDLYTREIEEAPDPAVLEATKMMVSELYNGIGHGRGKDVTVQLLRAFTESGDPLDHDRWLGAFYRSGGDFASGEDLTKFIREMKEGVRHRIRTTLRPNIVEILRDRSDRSAVLGSSASISPQPDVR